MRLLSLSADPDLRKEPNMLKICIRKRCEGCGLLAVDTEWGGFIKVVLFIEIFPALCAAEVQSGHCFEIISSPWC